MDGKFIVLFAALALTTLGLSAYLGFLYSRLRRLRAIQEEARQRGEAAWAKRQADIKSGLSTLALTLIQEQCEPTEACIRIKKLMDEIDGLGEQKELAVFHEMYEEVKDLAILQDYKDLSNQEKFKQDNRRFAIEEKYNSRLKKAANELRSILKADG